MVTGAKAVKAIVATITPAANLLKNLLIVLFPFFFEIFILKIRGASLLLPLLYLLKLLY